MIIDFYSLDWLFFGVKHSNFLPAAIRFFLMALGVSEFFFKQAFYVSISLCPTKAKLTLKLRISNPEPKESFNYKKKNEYNFQKLIPFL